MEKSKAYKEGIAIPAKRVLVKNPKIYGSIAIVFFVLGLVAVFLPIFQTRIPDAKVPENPDLFFKTYGAMQGGHWFPVFCVILSAVLSCACIALAFLGTRKEGKTMKAVVLIGLANVILLLFALLFMNTTTADYDAGKGVIAQTTIHKLYYARPMMAGSDVEANWLFSYNSFSWIGWAGVLAIALGTLISWIYTAAIPRITKLNAVRTLQSYLMIAISLTGLALFVVYPLAWVVRYSVFSYKGFGTMTFVGFDQFVTLFTKSTAVRYWQSVKNTFVFAIGKLLVEIPLALVLAFILTRKLRGASFFRAMYYMPSMVSVAVIGVIFFYLFRHEGGVINTLLRMLGGKGVQWFSNGWSAMLMLMAASIWQNFGLNMLFFMTGLQSISPEMYEAASIDGASNTRQFFSITVPLLGPVLQMVLMNALLGSLKVTDLVLTLTGGRPDGETSVMMTYIYGLFMGDAGVAKGNWGFAAACTVVTAIILGLVTVLYLKLTKKSADVY